MLKQKIYLNFIKLLVYILLFVNRFIKFFYTKNRLNSFLPIVHDMIESKQYYFQTIGNKSVKFFCPSVMSLTRVQTLHTKEPETINWMNNFDSNEKKIFWDIGSNIGLYSIYTAIKFQNINVVAFEPSTSNTRVLSRNITINKLSDQIKICSLPLCDKPNIISLFRENKFIEGWSGSTFDNNFDQNGEPLPEINIEENNYQIYGTSIDEIIDKKTLEIPNYIKIDVDGIEHLILKGAKELLKNKNLLEIFVEMNPGFTEQFQKIDEILLENGFKKIYATNKDLLKNKDHKLQKFETVNTLFKRI